MIPQDRACQYTSQDKGGAGKAEFEGIIEKITRPTAWCALMVPVTKKSGKVRICVDLKKLNLSVKHKRYILPTLEDVMSKHSGASVFSSLEWILPDSHSKREAVS